MFERFTEQARRTLFFARYEASHLGSLVIDTEHLLLGLIREGTGLTGPIFARLGVSREDIRRELEGQSAFREKVSTAVEIPFSDQAKGILQFASEEADRLSHNYVGTEHLLLGILREEESVAAAVLIHRGMRLSAVRDEVQRLLKEGPSTDVQVDTVTHFAEEHRHFRPPFREQNISWTIQFRDDEYWFEREGQAPEGPYCATCWDTERQWVRKVPDSGGEVHCGYCREKGRDW